MCQMVGVRPNIRAAGASGAGAAVARGTCLRRAVWALLELSLCPGFNPDGYEAILGEVLLWLHRYGEEGKATDVWSRPYDMPNPALTKDVS
jgi:hypothetical protein